MICSICGRIDFLSESAFHDLIEANGIDFEYACETRDCTPRNPVIIKVCECGGDKVKEPHLRWCPKHTK